ncbi:carbon-nitrogen hydrolase family protein [Pseudomonas typographi]|uniref:Carbon-nitrogen hydrolase family protein n=1 Tax=Pseudomonas typographi TaxID=2715964 RepID=A0ABR7YVD9_9PSED|nr:carbon-nitrogen hydrolase family protein [Pseudomonas typographi]MBD1552147.1 carbon-nitrogen hydrolase family protein [Pseudomonas typographi]MBD1585119.1 carbon-nitrogen hydrolase family protein [Pseudomonas typographi]MBD1597166.1 carbon-nitrogen hydrolase family protein [Pseudomonas typographi]
MKLALCQCTPLPLDSAGNLARLERFAAQAAGEGARLLVLPEMFSSGYNIGAAAVRQLAEAADGPFAQAAAAIARRHRIALCYGYPEAGGGGAVYNSARLLDEQGAPLLNYRKLQLFGDLDRQQFSAGAWLPTVAMLHGWQVGLQICYDIEFPEGARYLARAGAELILVPTANMRGFEFIAEVTVRSRAYENQCFVAYANYTGAEGALQYCGLSSVNGPAASREAMAAGQEGLLYAELDKAELTVSRRENPYLADLRTGVFLPRR